jgi:hypothetical protein
VVARLAFLPRYESADPRATGADIEDVQVASRKGLIPAEDTALSLPFASVVIDASENVNGFNSQTPSFRAFLDQRELSRQIAEFSVIPPILLQWFFRLLHYKRTYRTRQNWELSVLNYLSAMDAPAWGHKLARAQQIQPKEGHHA